MRDRVEVNIAIERTTMREKVGPRGASNTVAARFMSAEAYPRRAIRVIPECTMTDKLDAPKKLGRPPSGRPRDPLVAVRYPANTLARIDERAAREGVSRSELIRRYTDEGLERP
jgi:hypothetical protein